MANFTGYLKRYLNADIKTFYADITRKKDPAEFKPNGSQIYHGYQGEGKTISMYYHGIKLKNRYPKALLVTNLYLTQLKPFNVKTHQDLDTFLEKADFSKYYIKFESYEELILLLKYARNGKYGVIFMIDEIHNYFHSHDSKSMPMWIVQVFSQQRKQRLVILGTVQDWNDVIKSIRRQVDNLIACKRFGYVIKNTAIDPREIEKQYGETVSSIRKRGFFFITDTIRNGFDTFQVINSGREILGGQDLSVNVQNVEEKNTTKKRKKWGA